MTTIETTQTTKSVISVTVTYPGHGVKLTNRLLDYYRTIPEGDIFYDSAFDVEAVVAKSNMDAKGTMITIIIVAKASWNPAEDDKPDFLHDMPVETLLNQGLNPAWCRMYLDGNLFLEIDECVLEWELLA